MKPAVNALLKMQITTLLFTLKFYSFHIQVLLKTECGCLHGEVIENGHTRNPLTLCSVPAATTYRFYTFTWTTSESTGEWTFTFEREQQTTYSTQRKPLTTSAKTGITHNVIRKKLLFYSLPWESKPHPLTMYKFGLQISPALTSWTTGCCYYYNSFIKKHTPPQFENSSITLLTNKTESLDALAKKPMKDSTTFCSGLHVQRARMSPS